MMNRREFCGVVAAGTLFPTEILKSATPERLGPIPHPDGIPSQFLLTCLGTDQHPASDEALRVFCRDVARGIQKPSMHSHVWHQTSYPCLNHTVSEGFPLNAKWLNTEHLVLNVGNKSRPVTDEQVEAFRKELVHRLVQGETWMITNLAISTQRLDPSIAGLCDGECPVVLNGMPIRDW